METIQCPICHDTCSPFNKLKVAVTHSDGRVICNQCSDILDFGDSISSIVITKTKTKNISTIKSTSKTSILCPKCKIHISTKICNCGFKNPLFR